MEEESKIHAEESIPQPESVSKLRLMYTLANCIRTLPIYFFIKTTPHRDLIEKDFARWWKVCRGMMDPFSAKRYFTALNWILLYKPEYRNLLQHRFRKPPRTIASLMHYFICRILWRPMDSFELSCDDIGGGFFIQHGYSTHICAKRIGENCWVNQLVAIGFNGLGYPTLEDNVTVCCRASIFGDLTVQENSIVGAHSLVMKDVPKNAIVAGAPAKVLRIRSEEEVERAKEMGVPIGL